MPQDYLDGLDPAARVERWRDRLRVADERAGGDGAARDNGLVRGIVVAVADDVICGFTQFGPTRDADEDPQRTGEVDSIYMEPGAWGRGLGRMLMAEAVSQLAAGYEQATLWVLDTNDRARRFYARTGWAEDGAVMQDDSRGFPITEVRYRRSLT